MGKFLRYILSLRRYRQTRALHRLHKMKQGCPRRYVTALYEHLSEVVAGGDGRLTRPLQVNVRSNDLGELLVSLLTFKNCTLANGDGRYYIDLPAWYMADVRTVPTADYVTDNGYFLNLDTVVLTMNSFLQEIDYGVATVHNADLHSYYNKKANRLYRELISVGEALL